MKDRGSSPENHSGGISLPDTCPITKLSYSPCKEPLVMTKQHTKKTKVLFLAFGIMGLLAALAVNFG
jgi:hypothetical protein